MAALDGIRALQVYNLIRFGATLVISVLLTKSGLPTSEIALYEAFLFLSYLVSFFWLGGGQNGFLSLFPKRDATDGRRLLAASFMLFQLLAFLAAGALFWGGPWLIARFTHFHAFPYLNLLALFTVFHLPTILIPAYYLVGEQYRAIVRFGWVSFGLQMLLVLAPVFLGWGLWFSFCGLVFWGLLKYAWLWVLLWKKVQWQGWLPEARALLVVAFPLTLHLLIGNSVEYIDGLIVASFFQEEEMFAVFRYGARELPLVTLLTGALVTGLLPVVGDDPAGGLVRIKKRSLRLAHGLYPLSALMMVLSPLLFPIVFNPEFAAAAWVFNVYLLIISSRLLLPQVLIISHEKNYFLVASAVLETLVNVGLSLWWVRLWGLEGVAMASVVAYLVNKGNLIFYNWVAFGYRPGQYIPLATYFFYNSLLLFLFFATKWWYGG